MFTTITETAAKAANVVMLPEPEDELIRPGITLANADAKIIARRLRSESWAGRARFFNNIIYQSLENWGQMSDYAKSKEDGAKFLMWGMVEMARRIGETLELWGKDKKMNEYAVTLQLLSLCTAHRRAANEWLEERNLAPLDFIDAWTQKRRPNLAIFFRMQSLSFYTHQWLWDAGSLPEPEDWIDQEMCEKEFGSGDDTDPSSPPAAA